MTLITEASKVHLTAVSRVTTAMAGCIAKLSLATRLQHAGFSPTTNRAGKGQPLDAKAAETMCSHSSTQPVLQLTIMPKRSRRQSPV